MSYYTELPAWQYELPCGNTFRSLTRSVPLDGNGDAEADLGFHWFWCDKCMRTHEMRTAELRITKPAVHHRTDHELAKRVDAAIHCDRVATYYGQVWDGASVAEVAQATAASTRQVRKVAADLGVYSDESAVHSAVTIEDVSR